MKSPELLDAFLDFYTTHYTRHDWTQFMMWGDYSRTRAAGPKPRELLEALLYEVALDGPFYVVIHEYSPEPLPLSAAAAAWLSSVTAAHLEARELPTGAHKRGPDGDWMPCMEPGWLAVATLSVSTRAAATLLDGMAAQAGPSDHFAKDFPHLVNVFGASTAMKLTVIGQDVQVSAPWSFEDDKWAGVNAAFARFGPP
ncbi:MAG: hypothetical protein AAFV53_20440 [Myxococcota bacterium]